MIESQCWEEHDILKKIFPYLIFSGQKVISSFLESSPALDLRVLHKRTYFYVHKEEGWS